LSNKKKQNFYKMNEDNVEILRREKKAETFPKAQVNIQAEATLEDEIPLKLTPAHDEQPKQFKQYRSAWDNQREIQDTLSEIPLPQKNQKRRAHLGADSYSEDESPHPSTFASKPQKPTLSRPITPDTPLSVTKRIVPKRTEEKSIVHAAFIKSEDTPNFSNRSTFTPSRAQHISAYVTYPSGARPVVAPSAFKKPTRSFLVSFSEDESESTSSSSDSVPPQIVPLKGSF
jgi:hypothetical protein